MTLYLWIKTFHLLFVIAWMAAVFYLPRILVNIAEAGTDTAVRARLVLMGRRLYKFGHSMLGLALLPLAVLAQPRGALFRAGHRTLDAMADAAECVDEIRHRRAGADPDDHAVFHVIDRLLGGQAFCFGHG